MILFGIVMCRCVCGGGFECRLGYLHALGLLLLGLLLLLLLCVCEASWVDKV